MINECKNHTICTEPIVSIENVNCEAQNLSESELDMNACRIANVIIFL